MLAPQTADVMTPDGDVCMMIDGKMELSCGKPILHMYTDQSIDYIESHEISDYVQLAGDQLVYLNYVDDQICCILNQSGESSMRYGSGIIYEYDCEIIAVVSKDGTDPTGLTKSHIVRFTDDLYIYDETELPSYLSGFEFIGCVQGTESFYIRKSGDIYIIRCDQKVPDVRRCSSIETFSGFARITKLDVKRDLIIERDNRAAIINSNIDNIFELSKRASAISVVPNLVKMEIGSTVIITDLTSRPVVRVYHESKDDFLPILH